MSQNPSVARAKPPDPRPPTCPSTSRPTSSSSAAGAAACPPRCSPAGWATRWSCWRRRRSSAAPPTRPPSGTGCRTTSRCAPPASPTPRRTSCATSRGSRARSSTTRRARRSGSPSGSTRMSARSTTAPRPAAELLAERGALPYRHCAGVPDYWSELPEDKAPTGRVLVPERRRASDVRRRRGRGPHDDRPRPSATASTSARRTACSASSSTAARSSASRRRTADGRRCRVGARKAVIFATGGFTHDAELRANFLARAGLRRLRGAHQRGRLRPHRRRRSARSCAT